MVEWVEKASFDPLNRLFEIAATERSCETLLSAQNLRLVTQEPQPYVLNILPRRLPKEVVSGEHLFTKISYSTRRCVRQTPEHAKCVSTNGRRKGKKAFCGRLLVVNALRHLHLLAPQRKRRRSWFSIREKK